MVPFVILLLVLVLVVLPIWVVVRLVSLSSQNEVLERKLRLLDERFSDLQKQFRATTSAASPRGGTTGGRTSCEPAC